MAPFEMLYGHRCQTPLFWNKMGERKNFGPDIWQGAEMQVRMVRENLWIAQSRQKNYADHRRRELSLEVGGYVYLKVSPMRGLSHCKVRGQFTPRFVGSFKIKEGKRRRVEGRVFKFLFRSTRISGMGFILRGVGLSHSKISKFGM
jgi:hypothetical protein